jgi:hypothetical protein
VHPAETFFTDECACERRKAQMRLRETRYSDQTLSTRSSRRGGVGEAESGGCYGEPGWSVCLEVVLSISLAAHAEGLGFAVCCGGERGALGGDDVYKRQRGAGDGRIRRLKVLAAVREVLRVGVVAWRANHGPNPDAAIRSRIIVHSRRSASPHHHAHAPVLPPRKRSCIRASSLRHHGGQ